ncbi:hypothetical protein [endosymbiont GvMRE of Glomus versiforme]|uniref:hypothetical protein n=1 Tax=endosymbiont GvMRE of Glomus versiforme TaxID=2039283 RepID=UPI000EE5196C|nr:hypothetical protein [endosymbiont GvMRE of Glomus versiforme]RHZ36176.1 hypothetical protein GvMRE_Ic2g74 [endosymbiont GvMRE of Glomus versiforme]
MSGHNVNIYFSEKTYQKIKPLIEKRKVSEFVNKIVEKELEKEQKQEKEQLRKQLIAAHKRIAKNQKLKKELALWDETVDDYINNEKN